MLKRVRTPTLEVAYEAQGDEIAPAVILVHGFPDDARTWDQVAEPLASAGYRTLAPYVRGFGETRFLDDHAPHSGQYSAVTQDLIEFADALALDRFILVGHDWGAAAGYMAAALFPERVRALIVLAAGHGMGLPGYAKQPISTAQARAYWYQWYFNLEKGREVLTSDRRPFCQALWNAWSPRWNFDQATFEATAKSFNNPDFVDVVIHSYRYRWDNAPADPRYDALEARLAEWPEIAVPTFVIHGDEDGATLAASSEGKERFFAGHYERKVLPGVGHFIQRERPDAVVEAVRLARNSQSDYSFALANAPPGKAGP